MLITLDFLAFRMFVSCISTVSTKYVLLSRKRAAILRDVYLVSCINKAYGIPITVDETGCFCFTGDLMSSVRSTFRLYM